MPPAGGGLGELDELAGVARVRDREVRHQQVVRLLRRHLDPQRDAAQVGLRVGLAECPPRWRTGRSPGTTRPAGRSRPAGRAGRSRKRSSASSTARVDLAWNARSTPVRDAVRAGGLRSLELDAHDVAREPLELEPLGLGAAPDRGLCPRFLHAALPWPLVPRAERHCGARLAGHRSRNRASTASTRPWMTPSGDGL